MAARQPGRRRTRSSHISSPSSHRRGRQQRRWSRAQAPQRTAEKRSCAGSRRARSGSRSPGCGWPCGQNLPRVSVAVGSGGTIVWPEGFGWRDADTGTPVTPDTRFNIGTAASAVTAAAVAQLGLTNTGSDPAAEWSPPIGLAPGQPLPGDRATFYVPRSDDNSPRRGRRLMYMRDLACCAGGMAFYSTAPDLVRFPWPRKQTASTASSQAER
jgi:CubicO group peptidase (beta-lactamase class C family)